MNDLLNRLRARGVRLSLDGETLRCLAPKGALSSELREELGLRKVALTAFLNASKAVARSSIEPIPRTEEGLPLSFAQQRLWLMSQLVPEGSLYNVPVVIGLRGALDVASLQRALAEIVMRHETLRTVFRDTPLGPVQIVDMAAAFVLDRVVATGEDDALRIATEQLCRGFDLTRGPMFRGMLARIDDAHHLLILTMHHIVSDGWSTAVLLDELGTLYEAFRRGEESSLASLDVQYADYATWQRRSVEHGALSQGLAYWREHLDGARELLELPADHARPAVQTYRGAKTTAIVPPATLAAAKNLARCENATPFMVLLAAFKTLLHRYTGANDLVVGSPIAGRNRTEVEKLIGFFVNTLVLRTEVGSSMTFRDVVARVRKTCIDAFAHQDVPFDRLVEIVRPERDLSHHPLFQVAFVMQSEPASLGAFRTIEASRHEIDNPTEKFGLTLDCEEIDGALRIRASYSVDLFERPTIDRMLGHFATLLGAAAASPDSEIGQLPMLDVAEAGQIESWGDPVAAFPHDKTIHEIFAEQALRTPGKLAIIAGEERITYGELHGRSIELAGRLAAMGVGTDTTVGMLMERSANAVVAALAILQAGGAYVPLDPSYPDKRIVLMMRGAGVSIVVRQDLQCSGIATENSSSRATPDSLAYVVYTSGSTGTPKGVAVPHRAVVRLVKNNDFAHLDESEVLLHFAPLAFDASTLEIWGALLNGGTVVIVPPNATLEELAAAIAMHGVTTMWLTAGLFHAMVEERIDAFGGVRQLLAGGDVLSPVAVARLLHEHPALRVINGYGPTESTTFTSCHSMTFAGADSIGANVPIGRPIRNTRVRILDARLQPVPAGVPGELFIGGDGLARGYAGDAALTATKFIPDPMRSGQRLFRTGDLVRWRTNAFDGGSPVLEFLGRIDEQVKIRGFRIEPGEIEAALAADARVREAVVVVRSAANGEKSLVAYAVPGGPGVTPAELRETLAHALPSYMLPSRIVLLEAMPLTPNGKIDRHRLPKDSGASPRRVRTLPRDSVERLIAHVWRELLAVDDVCIDDNFFHLGGHSLLATRMASRLRSLFRSELFSLATIFESPTVAGLATLLRTGHGAQVERVADAWHRLQNMTPDELANLARRRTAVTGEAL